MRLDDFSLRFEAEGDAFTTVVQESPQGEGRAPFGPQCMDDGARQICQSLSSVVPASGRREDDAPQVRGAHGRNLAAEVPEESVVNPQSIGKTLFQCLFVGEVKELHDKSMGVGASRQSGLRLCFHMALSRKDPANRLVGLPWEFLCDDRGNYLALNPLYSIVRYPEHIESLPVPRIEQPLYVLILVVNPRSLAALDGESEAKRIVESFRNSPTVRATWIRADTTEEVHKALLNRQEPIHILHFIGHGDVTNTGGQGVLLFETPSGALDAVDGQRLKVLLGGHPEIQLVVLNACLTASFSQDDDRDPLTGVAAWLLSAGLPAVIAMQFPITDDAAIDFSRGLYARLAAGDTLDAAVVEGRRTILVLQPDSLEWATPALFMRVRNENIFRVAVKPPRWQSVVLEIGKSRQDISADYERALTELLADFLQIAATDLVITRLREESARIALKLPADAEGRLLEAARTNNPKLEKLFTRLSVEAVNPPPWLWTAVMTFLLGILGNLLAAWVQKDLLRESFTLGRVIALVVLSAVFLYLGLFTRLRRRFGRRGMVATVAASLVILTAFVVLALVLGPPAQCGTSRVELNLPTGPRSLELGGNQITDLTELDLQGLQQLTGRAVTTKTECPCAWSFKATKDQELIDLGSSADCAFTIDLPAQASEIFLQLETGKETYLFTLRIQ
jgi:hypothetical protein